MKDDPYIPVPPEIREVMNKAQSIYATENSQGITKRELIAAMAMQGLCACPMKPFIGEQANQLTAKVAIDLADALFEGLEKK